MMRRMNRLAVLGQPIAHSLSPAMHTAAFEAVGIGGEWTYEAIELSPEQFAAGVEDLRSRGYRGANVTVPHKVAALAVADDASPAAREIGAANTLTFGPGGVRADNTDAPGLIAALPGPVEGSRALVLGAGGAARASVWALLGAGADVVVHNRTRERAEELVADLGGSVLDRSGGPLPLREFDLLVNTTSIGLAKPGAASESGSQELKGLGLSADEVSDRLVVVDLVYGTEATELSAMGRRGGARIVDGLEILVHQGAESFRIWTGEEPPIEAMRRAVREHQR
jgi:shikimate dehydrogenase